MDYKAYIESGKLESYVLGLCTAEEAMEAECMARVFPEIKTEMEAIRSSFEQYSLMNAATPPAALKSKIFAAIDEEKVGVTANDVDAKIIAMPKQSGNSNSYPKMMIAASVTLFIVSSFVALLMFDNNNKLAQQINQMQINVEASENQLVALQLQLKTKAQQLQVINNAHTLPVAMKGLALSPQSLATIYWNKESKEVFLSVNSLPKPAAGKQYQLWAIVNGAPVDLGVFDLADANDSLLQKMKPVAGASAFAITLENKGGSAVPTLTEMYVLGNS